MRRLSGIDTAFLYLETPTTHMQVQAVMLLDPSTVPGGYSFEKIKAHLASRLPLLPEFRRRLAPRAVRPAPAGVVRRPRLRLRLPRAPHRGAGAGQRRSSSPTSSATSPAARSTGRGRSGSSGSSRASRTARSRCSRGCTTRRSTACRVRACSRASSISRPSRPTTPAARRLEARAQAVGLRAGAPRDHVAAAPAAAARARAGDAEPGARRGRRHACSGAIRAAVGRHAVQHAAHAVERAAHAAPPRRLRLGAARRGEGDEERVRLHGERHRARDRDRRAAPVPAASIDALPDRPLLAACPVSVRNDETDDIESANKVSAMFVSLPTHLDDVEAQIEHIRDATKGAKDEHQAVGARTLLELGELAGPRTLRAREPAARRARRPRAGADQPRDLQRARAAVPAVPRRRPRWCRCCRSARRSKAPG